MAAPKVNIAAQCSQIIAGVRAGNYSCVYLLMGEEPYYPELVCKEILANCIDESSKDFNELVCYGPEVTAEQVITAARQFPMMSDRVLVVLKEAQAMKTLEQLSVYLENPLESTVLVILMHGASADKRKSLYKMASKIGVVVDSPALRDYEIASWIGSYFTSVGLQIAPDAAALMGESLGTDLSTIVAQTEKLRHNLADGQTLVSVQDIERNIGVSRQFSVFELTKALSARDSGKALSIAAHIGNGAKFAMPMAVSALFNHFNRILRYGALLSRGGSVSAEDKAAALSGVHPYFYREYDQAVRNYPLPKAMQAISLLCEYDYLG